MRGIEKILVVIGAISFGWMGYKLFLFGVTTGMTKVSVQGKAAKLIFSGTGPGLFFMLMAGLIMIVSVLYGGASRTESVGKDAGDDSSKKYIVVRTQASLPYDEQIEIEKMLGKYDGEVGVMPRRKEVDDQNWQKPPIELPEYKEETSDDKK